MSDSDDIQQSQRVWESTNALVAKYEQKEASTSSGTASAQVSGTAEAGHPDDTPAVGREKKMWFCVCGTTNGAARTTCGGCGRAHETSAPQPTSADDETPCAVRDDGLHCECWYGGNTCCGCGDGDRTLGGEWPTCAEVRAAQSEPDART